MQKLVVSRRLTKLSLGGRFCRTSQGLDMDDMGAYVAQWIRSGTFDLHPNFVKTRRRQFSS